MTARCGRAACRGRSSTPSTKSSMQTAADAFPTARIARIAAHLKTFAKWIHTLRPFRLGDPTEKLKTVLTGPGLEIERALTESQRRKLLDAADHLPVLGGRSRDRRRSKDVEFADERPRRKGYRPWRNRAIVYCLIETGMRRAAVCNLDLGEIDFEQKSVTVREKGGQTHRYKISKEGAKAIQDYLREERGGDQEMFPAVPGTLPAAGDGGQQFRPLESPGDQHRLERGLPLGERQGQDAPRRPPCHGPAHHGQDRQRRRRAAPARPQERRLLAAVRADHRCGAAEGGG